MSREMSREKIEELSYTPLHSTPHHTTSCHASPVHRMEYKQRSLLLSHPSLFEHPPLLMQYIQNAQVIYSTTT